MTEERYEEITQAEEEMRQLVRQKAALVRAAYHLRNAATEAAADAATPPGTLLYLCQLWEEACDELATTEAQLGEDPGTEVGTLCQVNPKTTATEQRNASDQSENYRDRGAALRNIARHYRTTRRR